MPFIAAVETREGRPQRLHFRRVAAFSKEEIAAYAKASPAAGSKVESDGLDCFEAVTEAGCRHKPLVKSGIVNAHKLKKFHWVSTALGNLETSTRGTFQSFSGRHAGPYLGQSSSIASTDAPICPPCLSACLPPPSRPSRDPAGGSSRRWQVRSQDSKFSSARKSLSHFRLSLWL